MKTLWVIGLFLLTGCSATMVSTRGDSHSLDAPTNEAELRGGVVKYLASGSNTVVQKRRANAYKKMRSFCNGPYSIEKESFGNENAVTVPVGGVGYSATEQYLYISFQCKIKPEA